MPNAVGEEERQTLLAKWNAMVTANTEARLVVCEYELYLAELKERHGALPSHGIDLETGQWELPTNK